MPDLLSPEELTEIEHATGPVAGYALRELVRVYRAAMADTGLAARMFRETRIITLEAEVGRLRPVVEAAKLYAGLRERLSTINGEQYPHEYISVQRALSDAEKALRKAVNDG